MDENKKRAGRPQVYDDETSGYGRELEYRRRMKAREQERQREAEKTKVQDNQRKAGNTQGQMQQKAGNTQGQIQREDGNAQGQIQREARNTQRQIQSDGVKVQAWRQKGKDEPKKEAKRENPQRQMMEEKLMPLRTKLEQGQEGIRKTAQSVTGSERHREQKNALKMQVLIVVLGVLVVLLAAAIIYEIVLGHGIKETGQERMANKKESNQIIEIYQSEAGLSDGEGEDVPAGSAEVEGKKAEGQSGEEKSGEGKEAEGQTENGEGSDGAIDPSSASLDSAEVLSEAQLKAAQYDYDGAITLLKSVPGYGEDANLQAAVDGYEKQKAECVAYPASEVTHIFFHTLIHDPKKAFDGDEYESGYNQFMVTENEFNSIIQQMYDRGYVMVFLDDFAPGTDDGSGNKTFAAQDIMLPPGKTPFVLSQDDVSYYHYMDGDGFASRLIVDENGDVKNEYIEDDGSVSVGDYDMVPLIDRFVEKHPDFSYRGAKGYVALTGYEGILGYRTDEVYKTKEAGRVTPQQQMFFDSYPGGFDEAAFEKECEGAKKVAEAMKANGWKFASHTWGHQNLNEINGIGQEGFKKDTDRWENWVEPLIGDTDTLIYAFGGDIRGMEKYSGERFNYLKQCGFDYYCGVDSAKYWVQIEPNYVRQSRRNVDGYRMFYNPDMLSDLFDVQEAWDPLRPSYVPEI